MFWLRPDLSRADLGDAGWFDTALFDIDGVLIDPTQSYRLSVIAATDAMVRQIYGFKDAPDPLVTAHDVELFKLAGGFNSDWDLTQALVGLWVARLREWRGAPLAERTLAQWAEDAAAATRAGVGGGAWLHATVPASAIPTWDDARWTHDEFYWGATLLRDLHGHEPQFAPPTPGLRQNERSLLPAETLPALAALGLDRFGIITGRVSPEIEWALRLIAPDGVSDMGPHGPQAHAPFAVIVSASQYAKPDPQALRHALETLDAHAAVYIGDTADDLDLVLRYRAERHRSDVHVPATLAVSVATGVAEQTFRQRGADITIPSIGALPTALAALRERIA